MQCWQAESRALCPAFCAEDAFPHRGIGKDGGCRWLEILHPLPGFEAGLAKDVRGLVLEVLEHPFGELCGRDHGCGFFELLWVLERGWDMGGLGLVDGQCRDRACDQRFAPCPVVGIAGITRAGARASSHRAGLWEPGGVGTRRWCRVQVTSARRPAGSRPEGSRWRSIGWRSGIAARWPGPRWWRSSCFFPVQR
jgi:hypothetical protein